MYKAIEEIKAANLALGQHWFSKDTMRYFGTRIHGKVYGGKYFVTSDFDFNHMRFYSVRACVEGKIETIGVYQAYTTLERAIKAVKEVANEESHES